MAPPRFIVTGCARSGTVFMAQLMTCLGIPCTHEKCFNPRNFFHRTFPLLDSPVDLWGESSWCAAGCLDRIEVGLPVETVILHQVRNPVCVVRSHSGLGIFGPEKILKWHTIFARVLVGTTGSPVDQGMHYWLAWNRIAEKLQTKFTNYYRYKVEDVGNLESGVARRIMDLLGLGVRDRALRNYMKVMGLGQHSRRRDPSVSWATFPEGGRKRSIRTQALRYGYTDKDLQEA